MTGEALGIAKQLCAMHWGLSKKLGKAWGLKTDKDRILAIGQRVGEGLMKTLSHKKKSDLKLEM